MNIFLCLLLCSLCLISNAQRSVRALQKSHEKTPLEKWEQKFLTHTKFDQTASLVNLLSKIALEQLNGCTTVILYDQFTEKSNDLLLQRLLRAYPISYVHGQITEQYQLKTGGILQVKQTCVHYLLFLKDVMRAKTIIGSQIVSKVVLVARSSQWRVYEFLSSEQSQNFLNLLVVAMQEKIVGLQIELPYILYTHQLYIDALGSSTHKVLTSWKNGSFTRPQIKLFPSKLHAGFAGHRFIISAANQPPYVIKKGKDLNDDTQWEGIEIRLMELLAKMYNFTTDYREAKDTNVLGSAQAVTGTIQSNKGNLGIGGMYVTEEVMRQVDASHLHSQDCAAFISLTSTALPRYRAIMGPFHWTVWIALIFIYMFAIVPLAFSDKHTLRHLVDKPQEIENMFWYVFGTFTNAFTFVGKKSWSKSDKVATRLLIGFYWMFTIIITACYTGSIIAFVTLPIYPDTVDTPKELLHGHYQVGTLNKGGWEYWFLNSTDPIVTKLLKNIDLVPDIESGLKNVTKAFFWPYAFLASRDQLDYIVRTNFTSMSKRSMLHISNECFVSFGVGVIYAKNTLYSHLISMGILRVVQSGLVIKMRNDVEWNMVRSATGKLLAASSAPSTLKTLSVEDRALTLDDTQGMFLLLLLGFIMGGASLLSEWLGGCFNFCLKRRAKSSSSIESNCRSHTTPTPREKIDSLRNNRLINPPDEESEFEIVENGTENSTCIVHYDANHNNDDDIEEEINRLFNFDDMFGDENTANGEEAKKEELVEEIGKEDKKTN